ncbi:MAG: dCTP deaminase [Endomicrobia bacterium]|nr:dCTP deaminase [Endomicrobiia bacterium]MDW8056572.1 dCTP deaminase [Elusimicrobiota bacterium]
MMLNDKEIKKYVEQYKMIEPFEDNRVVLMQFSTSAANISWGVSSYGYDLRLADEFLVPQETQDITVDPKNFDVSKFDKIKTKEYIIPANNFVLGRSLEYFRIPRDILVIVFGKSTYARCGLVVNITPLEPEWEGYITISIINPLNHKIKIYANEGIAQAVFIKADKLCEISYKDKKGKYQAQKDITVAK